MCYVEGVQSDILKGYSSERFLFRKAYISKGHYSKDFIPKGHYSEDFYPEGSE